MSIGAIIWSISNCHHGWRLYVEFIFFAFGVYASRINTALIAITLLLLVRKTKCFVMKLRPYLIAFGLVSPGILVLIMLVVVQNEVKPHGDKTDPNFQYGNTQAMASVILLSVAFLTSIIALIVTYRSSRRSDPVSRSNSEDDPSRYLLEESNENIDSVDEIEDISGKIREGVMVFILVGQDILSTKLLVGQNLLFCPFLVIKVPIIGGAAAHPAPPICNALTG